MSKLKGIFLNSYIYIRLIVNIETYIFEKRLFLRIRTLNLKGKWEIVVF
ncbi:hypothetical protein BH09BAC4_BH09BAC4_19300 [soil metagenome]